MSHFLLQRDSHVILCPDCGTSGTENEEKRKGTVTALSEFHLHVTSDIGTRLDDKNTMCSGQNMTNK